jgi:hypothetical protein
MKLLLEGSLSETLMLKDLLAGILQAEAPGVSVLQLFVDNKEQYGEIFFLGGHFVVGARLCKTETSAQEALDQLLQLKEASFNYNSCESLEALPADKPLKIDLKELVLNWQFVQPLSSNELLDKIFNEQETTQERRPVSIKPKNKEANDSEIIKQLAKEQSRSPFTDKQSDIDWELVNPLLIGGGPGDKAINLIGNDWEEHPHSTHDLRHLAAGQEWQRKLRDLILILIMLLIALIVILCFAWLLMNSPSSEISPRRYPSPFFHHGSKKSQSSNHIQR